MPDAVKPPGSNAKPALEQADLTGRTLGGFQVLRRIGAGGMGQVYLARQLSLKRDVALKLLRTDLIDNPTAMKRFEGEAHAVATLNHPNIVQVYEFGEHDGLHYMALEYVDGRNLREHLVRKGPPDLPVALSIMRQVSIALQKAHERGIVHRDIKPENILVTRKVEVKVTDFGLSRFFIGGENPHLTQSGVTLGTPLYLSPEQAQGHQLDHRSDIYSFGVTCYHLLAGEPPFRGITAIEVALKHVTDTPQPLSELRPDLPPDLCGMIHKMMAKLPGDRYPSAREILRDIAKVKEGLSLGLSPGWPSGTKGSLGSTAPLTLSGSSMSGPAGSITGESSARMGGMPGERSGRWKRWLLAGLGVLVAGAVGALADHRMHPAAETSPAAIVQRGPGLPEVHPPEKLTTARERELLAVVKDRETPGERWVEAGIELGLLYLRVGRLDEAQARFEAMDKIRLDGPQNAAAHFAGRLGKATVAAYRDGDPQAATASLAAFGEAIATALPKTVAKGTPIQFVQRFFLRHPDMAQAVSEALNRNAINGGQSKLQQPLLEQLRSPRGLAKKE